MKTETETEVAQLRATDSHGFPKKSPATREMKGRTPACGLQRARDPADSLDLDFKLPDL